MSRAGRRNASIVGIDLGACAGRVVVAQVRSGSLELAEVHRFSNEPVERVDGLHWNADALRRETILGLRRAALAADDVVSVGIDTWAVDYGLVDEAGELLDDPFHYRDA